MLVCALINKLGKGLNWFNQLQEALQFFKKIFVKIEDSVVLSKISIKSPQLSCLLGLPVYHIETFNIKIKCQTPQMLLYNFQINSSMFYYNLQIKAAII